MLRIIQLAALFVITSVSFGQEVTPNVPPAVLSEWIISGRWVCPEGFNVFPTREGRGANCELALKALDDILDKENPGLVCTDVNGENAQPAIKEYDECVEDGGGGEVRRSATPPQDGPWVIRLIYQFGNGQTHAARGTGCTYAEAYQKAWHTIQLLAKNNCGVCCCTGKCVVLKRPCCQAVSACPSRARCRHR